ncbi:MAG: chaperone modulator CbpM [Methylovulum sp.]|nr:chaperone modulator CbpM [Methylovulum sp.]
MKVELTEVRWLDQHYQLSLADLSALSGLPKADLLELVDYGIFVPIDPKAAEQAFHADCLVAARTACRLRRDFDLDTQGLALALTLLERIHELEAQLSDLRARVPGHPR